MSKHNKEIKNTGTLPENTEVNTQPIAVANPIEKEMEDKDMNPREVKHPTDPQIPMDKDEVEEKQVQNDSEDRSSYNCPDCKGEGLINEKTLCSKCLGTGKV